MIRVMIRTCHFRQPGLNEGRPDVAPSSVANIYRVCFSRDVLFLCGSSFAGYVRKGNSSKTRLTGAGSLSHCREVFFEGPLDRAGLDVAFSSSWSMTSFGIVKIHAAVTETISFRSDIGFSLTALWRKMHFGAMKSSHSSLES